MACQGVGAGGGEGGLRVLHGRVLSVWEGVCEGGTCEVEGG